MEERARKIGRSLVCGQVICVLIALGHVVWRFIRMFIWPDEWWYVQYLFEYFVWSVVLLIATFLVVAATCRVFSKEIEGDDENAPVAFLPGFFCVLFMASFVYDFEYVVLLGIFDGIEFRTFTLGAVVVFFYLSAIVFALGESETTQTSVKSE